jgi:hypothetical protein
MHQDKLTLDKDYEWLSQLVAEPFPDWLMKRSLLGALTALQYVGVIQTAEMFCDLLIRGQHPFFGAQVYPQYFEDNTSHFFWLGLYALYDIGKTKKLSDHFQEAQKRHVDPPKSVEFMPAPVKGFKRIMEKLLQYTKDDDTFEAKARCAAEVIDKARNSYICETEKEMIDIVKKFNEMDGTVIQVSRGVKIRLTAIQGKCGFHRPSKGGWADIKYWTLVEQIFQDDPDPNLIRVGHALVAETQVILKEYQIVKDKMHLAYECSRGDFDTSKVELEAARKSVRNPSKPSAKVVPIKVAPMKSSDKAADPEAARSEKVEGS